MQLDSEILDLLQSGAEQYKQIENEISNLVKKQSDLKASILAACPVKIGQKVLCRGKTYLVYEVKCNFYFYGIMKASFKFLLTKPKKDGSMPSKCLEGTWADSSDLEILD